MSSFESAVKSHRHQVSRLLKKNCLRTVAFGIGLFISVMALYAGMESLNRKPKKQLAHNASLKRGMLEKEDPEYVFVHKAMKSRRLTYQTNSWKEMDADEGNSMIVSCNSKTRRYRIYLERTYATSGATKTIMMCPPGTTTTASGDVLFKRDVIMSKDESGRHYSLTGCVLLNSEGEVCEVDSDCGDGLFCNERKTCEKLPAGSCLLEREDRDCLILKDPLMSKCYITEGLFAQCSCNNDPSKDSCLNTTQTCDFPCQIADATPSCESPQERNEFCVLFTGIKTSECPPGGISTPMCTTPPTTSPTSVSTAG
ncbi:hypothetical protein ACHAW6_009228 [Cyclotella cf. meneghiniana]